MQQGYELISIEKRQYENDRVASPESEPQANFSGSNQPAHIPVWFELHAKQKNTDADEQTNDNNNFAGDLKFD